jgi:capsule polysaccharide export protein KpsE/RkpR
MERSALPRKVHPENPNVAELTGTFEVRSLGVLYYLNLLKPWLRWMAVCAGVAIILTYLTARLLLTHWYQAQAVLRPASQEPQTSLNLGSLFAAAGQTGGFSNIFGVGAPDVQEMLSILAAHQFDIELIRRNNLAPILLAHKPMVAALRLRLFGGRMDGATNLRALLLSRFEADFDNTTGNLTIGFVDPDPRQAQRILQLFIDKLLDRLRQRAHESSAAAIAALEKEISQTSDTLLVSQLDQLLAVQLQQLGTSEVQADFAFVVIDPPFLPEFAFSPRPFVDALVAALLVPLLVSIWVIAKDIVRRVVEVS